MNSAIPTLSFTLLNQVTPLTNSSNQIIIHTPTDLRTRGRNVYGLLSCTMYSFEVYTLYRGLRSRNSEQTELFTSEF